MKIAMLSKADSAGGGASSVAETLQEVLSRDGHDVIHFAAWSSKGFGGGRQPLYGGGRWWQKGVRAAHEVSRMAGLAEMVPFELPRLLKAGVKDFDLLHFHDLSSAISPWTLYHLSRYVPVVWTIHDCSPFTGGCLYPMECERFRSHCGPCPSLGEWPLDSRFDFTHTMQRIKAKLHSSGRISCFTPSRWMADMAEASGKLPERPRVVPNAVDIALYKPSSDVAGLRRRLNLPEQRLILLASAGFLSDERKGIGYAVRAVRALADRNPFLLLVGSMAPGEEALLDGVEWHATGYVGDASVMADFYAAADLFLFCSLADNQPLAVLESMACGTPVIAFDTGGVPELVSHGEHGLVVPQKDEVQLVEAVTSVLDGGCLPEWRQRAREYVVRNHGLAVLLENHLRSYQAVIDKWHERGVHA